MTMGIALIKFQAGTYLPDERIDPTTPQISR